jgi:hypothetical protein
MERRRFTTLQATGKNNGGVRGNHQWRITSVARLTIRRPRSCIKDATHQSKLVPIPRPPKGAAWLFEAKVSEPFAEWSLRVSRSSEPRLDPVPSG